MSANGLSWFANERQRRSNGWLLPVNERSSRRESSPRLSCSSSGDSEGRSRPSRRHCKDLCRRHPDLSRCHRDSSRQYQGSSRRPTNLCRCRRDSSRQYQGASRRPTDLSRHHRGSSWSTRTSTRHPEASPRRFTGLARPPPRSSRSVTEASGHHRRSATWKWMARTDATRRSTHSSRPHTLKEDV